MAALNTMMNRTDLMKSLAIASLLLASASQVSAEDAQLQQDTPGITFSGSATLVSDYLFRGISQTWGRPALQLWMEANHPSGLYGGMFASNVSDQMFSGTHLELDFYGGKRGKLPGGLSETNYDLGLIYVFYPSGDYDEAKFTPRYKSSRFNTVELYGSLNYKWFTVKTGRTLTQFFGWNTNNSGLNGGFYGDPDAGVTGSSRGSWYAEGSASVDLAPGWNVNAMAGHQTIANSRNLDWDYYKVGVNRTFGSNWVANLSYSGTSDTKAYEDFWGLQNTGATYDVARERVVFSLTRNF